MDKQMNARILLLQCRESKIKDCTKLLLKILLLFSNRHE